MKKSIYTVFIGGNIGNNNMLTSTNYDYDDETFEYLGSSSLYDGGEKARKEGAYTFESIKDFVESRGKEKLVPLEKGRVS